MPSWSIFRLLITGERSFEVLELPDYQVCSYCIMDTTDFEITFDGYGTCRYCTSAEETLRNKSFQLKESPDKLLELISEMKLSPGNEGFHGIIGVSGGADSSYLVHALNKSGLKLLAVHVDAGWNSIEAVRNIHRLVSTLDLELETLIINWEEMKDLQLSYLKSGVINQDVPQDHVIFSSLFKLAQKFRIKYIISGSNLATESILPESWGQDAMDGLQLKAIHRRYGRKKLNSYPITLLSTFYFHNYLKEDIKFVSPLNLMEYSKQDAIEVLRKEYNWEDYGGKHKESRFTDFFQEIYLKDRFGIEKKRAHLSSLIVNGEISRIEAINILSNSQVSDLSKINQIQFIATKLGISSQELIAFMKMPFVPDEIFQNQRYLRKILKVALGVKGLLAKPRLWISRT